MSEQESWNGWRPEEQFARALLRGVVQESKSTSTFTAWWIAAVGAVLGFALAHSDETERLLGRLGLVFALLTLTAAALFGLFSEWFSLIARRCLSIARNFERALPQILKENPEFDLAAAFDLALSTQPALARFNARRGARRALRFSKRVQRLAPDALAARNAFWQTTCVNVMVVLTLAFAAAMPCFFLLNLYSNAPSPKPDISSQTSCLRPAFTSDDTSDGSMVERLLTPSATMDVGVVRQLPAIVSSPMKPSVAPKRNKETRVGNKGQCRLSADKNSC